MRIFLPGASPERIETEIVNDLEIKLREVEEIDELESIITQGFSTIVVELNQSVHPMLIEETWSKVQDKLSQILIPQGAEIFLDRSSGPPITVQYAVTWNGSGEAPLIMMSRLANQLKRKLSSIGSSHQTAIFGETDEEILIELDSSKLSSLGLSFHHVLHEPFCIPVIRFPIFVLDHLLDLMMSVNFVVTIDFHEQYLPIPNIYVLHLEHLLPIFLLYLIFPLNFFE